ncbi:DUF1345 domain-containing protein [Saccharopolyspora sp. NPDC050642]|uniref:DUF1345 domain-containing protein n=1 Tax=Saccharopolyspora sp. NPDC050642 TaxID=3157099 RepID=UPI0033FF1EC4
MSRQKAAPGRLRRRPGRAGTLVITWIIQLAIAVTGIVSLFDPTLVVLLIWCVIGSLYAAATVITLALRARTNPKSPAPDESMPRWFGGFRVVIELLLTIVPTAIGVTAALQVIVFGKDVAVSSLVKLLGVWAMLLAWVFLHWGYAQVYASRSESARAERIFEFPGTDRPNLIDHVYFAFTVGTTFATSDVNVLTTRTRWLATVHSVLSFFMNALIIVLSFNTIMNAGQG